MLCAGQCLYSFCNMSDCCVCLVARRTLSLSPFRLGGVREGLFTGMLTERAVTAGQTVVQRERIEIHHLLVSRCWREADVKQRAGWLSLRGALQDFVPNILP